MTAAQAGVRKKLIVRSGPLSPVEYRVGFAGLTLGSAGVGRKAQTQSLPQLIANVRSIFRNEIDKMMTPFKKSNADFYNGYFAARVIVNLAATHAAPKNPTLAPP